MLKKNENVSKLLFIKVKAKCLIDEIEAEFFIELFLKCLKIFMVSTLSVVISKKQKEIPTGNFN